MRTGLPFSDSGTGRGIRSTGESIGTGAYVRLAQRKIVSQCRPETVETRLTSRQSLRIVLKEFFELFGTNDTRTEFFRSVLRGSRRVRREYTRKYDEDLLSRAVLFPPPTQITEPGRSLLHCQLSLYHRRPIQAGTRS